MNYIKKCLVAFLPEFDKKNLFLHLTHPKAPLPEASGGIKWCSFYRILSASKIATNLKKQINYVKPYLSAAPIDNSVGVMTGIKFF